MPAQEPSPRNGDPGSDVCRLRYDFQGRSTPLCMNRCGGKDQVVRQIEAQGWRSYEAPLPVILSQLVSCRPTVFLDIGANTGFYSLVAALAGAREIRAFEPVPFIADLLEANIGHTLRDDRQRISVQRQALSDQEGEASLHMPDQGHGLIETSASLDPSFRRHHSDVFPVAVTTLDRHLERNPLPRQHHLVLKIDVENCEDRVLRGGEASIARLRPLIVAEILPGADLTFYDDFLSRHRYRHFALKPPSQLVAMERIEASLHFRDHLLLPLEEDPRALLANDGPPRES